MKKNRRNAGKGYAIYLSEIPEFKPGDPPPTGYREWHEWARVQEGGGLKQTKCAGCRKYFYPQEAEAHKDCKNGIHG